MEIALEARAVSKRYGDVAVLDSVDIAVPQGTLALVTGRSGSGKSTLFKLLAGLDRPTSGHIYVEGRDIAALPDDEVSDLRLSRLGLVFQSFNLLPDLTVAENVRLPMDIAHLDRDQAHERVGELLELLGVDHRRDNLPHTLSGGEQQRVAIARALVMRPAIVLADEPTGNLDRKNAENVLAAFRSVNEQLRATVLIITHDPLAMELVEDHYHIEDGKVTWKGGWLSSSTGRAVFEAHAPASERAPPPR